MKFGRAPTTKQNLSDMRQGCRIRRTRPSKDIRLPPMVETKRAVRAYWDDRPCGEGLTRAPRGSHEYFAAIEDAKNRLEPYVHSFAGFTDGPWTRRPRDRLRSRHRHGQVRARRGACHGRRPERDGGRAHGRAARRRRTRRGRARGGRGVPAIRRRLVRSSSTPGACSITRPTRRARSARSSGCCARRERRASCSTTAGRSSPRESGRGACSGLAARDVVRRRHSRPGSSRLERRRTRATRCGCCSTPFLTVEIATVATPYDRRVAGPVARAAGGARLEPSRTSSTLGADSAVTIVKALFWASAGALVWTHAAYPLAARALARVRPRPVLADEDDASDGRRDRRGSQRGAGDRAPRRESPELDYPADRLELVVTSDASTDRTEALAEAAGARVIRNPRGGKVAAQDQRGSADGERRRRLLGRELHMGARRAAQARAQLRRPGGRLRLRRLNIDAETAATKRACTGATSSRCAPTSRASTPSPAATARSTQYVARTTSRSIRASATISRFRT